MMETAYINATIVTVDEDDRVVDNGYLIITDGKIREVGEGALPSNVKADRVVDLHGKWVLPGLINTHGHTGMTLLRGFADDLPLQEWLRKKMWPMEAQLNKELIEIASSLAILEMVKTGTTTFLDMYHLHLDTTARIVEQSGVRAVLTRGMIGLCSAQEQQSKLNEAIALTKAWHSQADGRITTMLSPHAPYTCPPSFIEAVVSEAHALELPLHIHLSETSHEVNEHVSKYGKRPVEHLHELDFFNGKSLIAHAVHLNDREIEILAEKNVAVSHNPISNLKLGSGIARVPDLSRAGVTVSLGTDSAASNNTLDLFEEMRMAALLHKGASEDPTAISAHEALRMATIHGAKSLNLKAVGSLEVDKDADFITIDPRMKPHLQPQAHVHSHLIYAATGADVCDVVVKGKVIMEDRECVTIDEERVLFEANRGYHLLNK
ncbi:amidohydrolase [Desertibacillus haloalkaliphilus]|uniref:amidohydrolase n=1 Tax=Desertibacillus haloalkaliphilus TaxID=1328930 RepID=UPI001C27423E|nr:amidohydrolase [Desertibacillus haloalkaliphilus]MBU8907282.1 amidohydrolase [Desertibacillus haloalkaliphilus]